LSEDRKVYYKNKYRRIKFGFESGSIGTAICLGGKELVSDIISSKLKAYGYKTLFSLAVGPLVSFISVPMYVLTYTSRFRPIAIATSEIGAMIIKGEYSLIDLAWLPCDLVLFGTPVSSTENITFHIFSNETICALGSVIEGVSNE
jgi:hypothetical protein